MEAIQGPAQNIPLSTLKPGAQARQQESPEPSDRIELSKDKNDKVGKDPALLMDTIRQLPKVDLHRHLDGAIKPETILRIAKAYGIELPADTAEGLKPFVSVTDRDKDLADFLKKFDIIGKLWVNTDAVKEISRQCVLDAKEENVKAMELRFSPEIIACTANLGLREIMDAVIEGVKEGEKETGIIVALTSVIPRHGGPENATMLEELTREYVKKGTLSIEQQNIGEKNILKNGFGQFTSIDLACNEALFPADPYAPVFVKSERDGIDSTIHAGEARGADSVKTALDDCHAKRIGHGYRSFEDPEVLKRLIDNKVTLEMCPTSSIQTGAVKSLESHPLKTFYDMGGRSTINTDDPGVCDTDLNKEYAKAVTRMGCSLSDVENMIVYAVDAMFLPPPMKAILHGYIVDEIKRVNSSL
jgi:adenosine deaminase